MGGILLGRMTIIDFAISVLTKEQEEIKRLRRTTMAKLEYSRSDTSELVEYIVELGWKQDEIEQAISILREGCDCDEQVEKLR